MQWVCQLDVKDCSAGTLLFISNAFYFGVYKLFLLINIMFEHGLCPALNQRIVFDRKAVMT